MSSSQPILHHKLFLRDVATAVPNSGWFGFGAPLFLFRHCRVMGVVVQLRVLNCLPDFRFSNFRVLDRLLSIWPKLVLSQISSLLLSLTRENRTHVILNLNIALVCLTPSFCRHLSADTLIIDDSTGCVAVHFSLSLRHARDLPAIGMCCIISLLSLSLTITIHRK